MRCNNCGWDNPAELVKCEKCNSPMKVAMIQQNSDNKHPINPIQGTVKGAKSDLPFLDEPAYETHRNKQQDSMKGNEYPCPNCGYPVVIGMAKCPECKYILENRQKIEKESTTGNKQKGSFSGTVNPYSMPKYGTCYLKPLPRENETPLPKIELSGNEIMLNRANLEPTNNSITSKEQAVIVNQEGKWIIVDKSNMKTTYILISQPIELKKGDVILLGDRKFEFDF